MASQDGEFWFRVASQPPRPEGSPVAEEYAKMTRRVFRGNYTRYTTWAQVVALGTTGTLLSPAIACWIPLLAFLPFGWARTNSAMES